MTLLFKGREGTVVVECVDCERQQAVYGSGAPVRVAAFVNAEATSWLNGIGWDFALGVWRCPFCKPGAYGGGS